MKRKLGTVRCASCNQTIGYGYCYAVENHTVTLQDHDRVHGALGRIRCRDAGLSLIDHGVVTPYAAKVYPELTQQLKPSESQPQAKTEPEDQRGVGEATQGGGTMSLELMVIDTQNAVKIFTGGGMAAILDGIESQVRAIKLDPSTASGRDEIRSVSYKIARTKTALDAEGKKLTEGWREATAKVNVERKKSADRLEALQDEIRKPLTDYENKEKVRVGAHEMALRDITGVLAMLQANPNMSLNLLLDHQRDFQAMLPGYQWEEFTQRAETARAELSKYLFDRIEARKRYEVEQEELSRLRKAETERQQRERDERLKAEAAEAARLQAERKAKAEADAEARRVIEGAEKERKRVDAEANRVRLENERQQRAAEDARKREESAKLAAEKRAKDAEAARIASEAKAAAELKAAREKARRDAEAAVVKERERVERGRKAEADARAKREADEALRLRIRAEILEDLNSATCPVDAIMDGLVRHVKVVF